MKTSLFTNTLKPAVLALVIFVIGLLSAGNANAACKAAFRDSVVGTTVYFTSTSFTASTAHVSLNWTFGDKTTGTGGKPYHTYSGYSTSYTVCLVVIDSVNKCIDTTCATITTGACKASAYFGATNGSGGSVSFTNYSTTTSGHYSSSWDFNDGKTGSTSKSPTHTYAANGVYHVCLYVVDSLNTSCNSTFCRYDTVKNATSCYAYYAWSLTGGHLYTSNGSTTKYGFTSSWSWGDGSANSTSKSPDHIYSKNGKYDVCLTVYDSIANCRTQYCDSIQVTGACTGIAHFVYALTTGMTVGFADSGSTALTNGDKHSVTWNFGDGSNYGTGDYTYHTYSKSNTYTVTVTVYDSVTKCTSTYSTSVKVGNCSLASSFKYSRTGNKFTFTSTSTSASKHSSYKWSYGDGSAVDSTSGTTATHTYTASAATEIVYLVIYDSTTGCVAYSSQTVTLCATKSDFTDKITGLSVAFAGDSTNSTTVNYSWNFGDKSTAGTGLRPSHTYSGNGTYSVCLTATDNATGCSSTTCSTINLCSLTASFTDSVSGRTVYFKGTTNLTSKHSTIKWYYSDGSPMDSTSGLNSHHTYASSYSSVKVYLIVYDSTTKCQFYATAIVTLCDAKSDFSYSLSGATVTLVVDTTNKSTVRFSWDFGDKTATSDGKKVTHTYTVSGPFSICLTATDTVTGCATTNCVSVSPPTCTLTASYTDSVKGSTVKFYGKSSASSHVKIIWIFGDGTTDSTSNSYDVSHTYGSSVSTESVYMRVYDSTTKCYTYGTGTVTICDANSEFSDKISGLTVAFGANTANNTRIKYSWNFGDKSDSRLAAPTHTYSTAGTYQVCLTATDSVTGCSTTTCSSVTVTTTCSLSVKFTDSILGHTVYFHGSSNYSSQHFSIKWEFGDGTIDSTTGFSASHNYGSTVTKEIVYLRVYDSTTKCLAYGIDTITLCTALSDYNYSISGLSVKFSGDPNTNSTVKYSWNFGDSSTVGTTSDPTHTYSAGGTYYVCLSVINGNTCSSSTCKYITVSGCTLTASLTDSINGHTVKFFGKSNLTSKHSSIKWVFGDGTVDSTTGFGATHTYASSVKSANVYLRIYDSTSKCLVYATTTITFCSVSASWTYAGSNLTVKFLADSTNPSGTVYAWNFGDGSNYGTTKDPTHTYSKAGTYRICLYTIDSPCTAYVCDSVTVTAPSTATYCISGTVRTSKVAGYPAKVFLITYNPKDSTLDSITTTQTNSKGFYEFCGLKNGTYYTKAALDSTNSYYKYFIPTYHYDATKWTGAQMITLNGASDTGENIIMKSGTNPGGAGFIGGKVSAGAGKTGDAEPDIEVVLYDSTGINPVAYTYTNSSGYYSFSGIAFGTYVVYGEVVGKVCYPAVVTITDTSSTNNTVDLLVKLTTITAAIKPAGAWTIEKADVYPNPVTNKLTLSMSIRNASPVTLKIYDITGKVVSQLNTTLDGGAQKMEVDASSLPAGLYFLRMEMTKENTLMEAQFVKVH